MRLAILGSTGSIGRSTLQVAREIEGPVEVVALAAGRNVDELLSQAAEFRPGLLSVADEADLPALREGVAAITDYAPRCACGPDGNLETAVGVESDMLVSAAVGVAGLAATHAAVRAGRRVALANKEVLVAAGDLVMQAAGESGAELLPVDSEHNAIHQCLRAGRREEVERIILTASGGPFRLTPMEELAQVTPASALRHPTWLMGNRITVDSATMMNKGFEVIEACHLFSLEPERVEVVVHPQSIVHAMVEFVDGSTVAQLSQPDMKLPIRYALEFPARQPSPRQRMDWSAVPQLEFEPPDLARFPMLALAYEALRRGGPCGCLLNAADEVAVEAFLAGRIAYLDIRSVVERTLEWGAGRSGAGIEEVMECDKAARAHARELVAGCEAPSGAGQAQA